MLRSKIAILDGLWAKIVRARDRCDLCGNAGRDFHAHHIIRRSNLFSRWETINGACLCVECHRKVHTNAKSRERLIVRLTERNGESWRDWIGTAENTVYKPTIKQMDEVISALKKILWTN
jgi:hypothetical protein